MHEMSLVRELVNVVLAECADKGVEAVTAVRLTVGESRDIIESYVPELFRYLARGTIAADAEVTMRRTPLRMLCRECSEIFPIDMGDEATWVCPRCGKRDYRVFSGEEFRIDSIEVRADPKVLEHEPTLVGAA